MPGVPADYSQPTPDSSVLADPIELATGASIFDEEDDKAGGMSSDDSEPSSAGSSDASSESESESSSGSSGGSSDSSSGSSSSISDLGSSDPKANIEEASKDLAELGLHVAPTDDPIEFIKHICTAAKTHRATKENIQAEQKGPETGMGADQGGVQQEEKPYLMSLAATAGINLSTLLGKDPNAEPDVEKRGLMLSLQAAVTRDKKKAKEAITGRIDKLAKKGVPVHVIEDLKKRTEGYQLSINPDGSYLPSRLDVELATWEKAAKHFKGGKLMSTMFGTRGAGEEPHPMRAPDTDKDSAENKETTQELCDLAGVQTAMGTRRAASKNGKK